MPDIHLSAASRATNGQRVFMHQRDYHNRITATLYRPPAAATALVPSLGRYIDEWVDSRGYEDAFIVGLFSAAESSGSSEDFVEAVAEMLPTAEARWVWRWLRLPRDGGDRLRDFNRTTV